MITRKIGKLLRGKATPFQIGAACVLGGALGFMPVSASAAGGLIVILTLLLIVLNANLFIAALVLGVAKLLSLALMPVSFQVGQILLDGPTRPLFKWAINTPVLALMDFRYYVTTGGLVLGLVFGVVVALVLNGALRRFRKTMSKLEEGSDRYKALNAKKSVRFATWLFFGKGHGKKTYEELMGKRIGLPVRPLGIVFAVLVIALLFVSQMLADGSTADGDAPLATGAGQRRDRGSGTGGSGSGRGTDDAHRPCHGGSERPGVGHSSRRAVRH
jgi:uncharacterized protein (TIGR03546 family)